MSLSVVLATYNEEKNLKNCLESVKDLADEIIVVDGGSTDKTVEISKSFGAKIIVTTNPPIFHINKQKAIEAATKDWVLQLDADERVTPELSKEIKSTMEQWNNETMGYWIPRKNFFLGRFLMKGGQYPDYTMRFYRRGKGKLPCKSVHEQAVVEGKTEYLNNPLIHLSDADFSRYMGRWKRYIDLIVRELEEEKKNSIFQAFDFLIFKPIFWFFLTYFRHKGFMDSWQGFLFSFFSSLRFPIAYFKFIKMNLFKCFKSFKQIGVIVWLCFLVFLNQAWANEYILPYPSLMPGHKLYQIKLLTDRIQEVWHFGSFARFKFYLGQADKYLVEAKTLFEYKQYLLAVSALEKSDENFEKVLIFLRKAEREGKNISEKTLIYQDAGKKHKEVLERLLKETPVEFIWQPEKREASLLKIQEKLESSLAIREREEL